MAARPAPLPHGRPSHSSTCSPATAPAHGPRCSRAATARICSTAASCTPRSANPSPRRDGSRCWPPASGSPSASASSTSTSRTPLPASSAGCCNSASTPSRSKPGSSTSDRTRRSPRPLAQTSTARSTRARALVVLDGLTEAFALQGADPDSNRQAAEWLSTVPRPIQDATGAAVLMIDHVTKSREGRGRYAIGAQHKLAGVAAAFSLDVIEPFGRGRTGAVKVSVVKDRHGAVREHASDGRHIATPRIHSAGDHVTLGLEAPGEPATDRAAFRPTTLMERVSLVIEEEPGLSKRAIRAAVKGKAEWVDLALELLIAEGFIAAERDGQAQRHTASTPYRADDDSGDRVPVSQPCLDRVPDALSGDRVPVSQPLQGDTVQDTEANGNGRAQPCPDPQLNGDQPGATA